MIPGKQASQSCTSISGIRSSLLRPSNTTWYNHRCTWAFPIGPHCSTLQKMQRITPINSCIWHWILIHLQLAPHCDQHHVPAVSSSWSSAHRVVVYRDKIPSALPMQWLMRWIVKRIGKSQMRQSIPVHRSRRKLQMHFQVYSVQILIWNNPFLSVSVLVHDTEKRRQYRRGIPW